MWKALCVLAAVSTSNALRQPVLVPQVNRTNASNASNDVAGRIKEERLAVGQLKQGNNGASEARPTAEPPKVVVVIKEHPLTGIVSWAFWIAIWGSLYYIVIASKYPRLRDTDVPTPGAKKEMEHWACSTPCRAPCTPNFFHAWCCLAPRAATTFNSTGIMNYWPSLCCMSAFPCCTLWIVRSCSDLRVKLGGEKQDPCSSGCEALYCACCMVMQDAEALDQVTGAKAKFCGVQAGARSEAPEQQNLPTNAAATLPEANPPTSASSSKNEAEPSLSHPASEGNPALEPWKEQAGAGLGSLQSAVAGASDADIAAFVGSLSEGTKESLRKSLTEA